jgi:membrane-associated phospholipid phosphatase
MFGFIGYGPIILFIVNIIFIWKKRVYLNVYLIGFLVNIYLNKLLKVLFREPRPPLSNPITITDNFDKEKYDGMPSGHAQTAFFSITYLYLCLRSTYLLITTLFTGLIILYQRWKYNNHYISQLIAGSLIGSGFSIFLYYLTKVYLVKASMV